MECTLKEKKDLLRKEIGRRRDALPPDERLRKSRRIQSRLFELPEIKAAQSIFVYVSFKSEVRTHELIRAAIAGGKNVAVPLTDMQNRRLLVYSITSLEDDLAPGAMGILEPRIDKLQPIAPDMIDIVITPGMVFSEAGRRIGYGGGFYDRFLRETKKKKSYALAYELQIVADLPFDPRYDREVDYIVTEDRIISCKINGKIVV